MLALTRAQWRDYGGTPDQSKFVGAPDITRQNVSKLEIAWMYPSGDERAYQFNPVIVDDVMYVLAKNSSLVAIDVVTRKELWIHANLRGITNRGINYWESKDRKDRRLLFTHRGHAAGHRCAHRQIHPDFRQARVRSTCAKGWGAIRDTIRRVTSSTPGPHLREPDHARQLAGRGAISPRPGTSARVQRRHRRTGLDLPHHSAARRVRLRHLAQGRVEIRRRRERLGRDHARCETRHRVFPGRRRPPTTTTARTASARTCSAIVCWRSMRAPASGCGTSRWCTTTCGTTTRRPRRS